MSVEQYGARLLSEVREETLDQLLAQIRTNHQPPRTEVLEFPKLDRLLEIFRRQPSNAHGHQLDWLTQQQSDILSEDELGDSPHRLSVVRQEVSSQQKPSVIELTSQRSAVGKTTLLYHLTGLAILPTKYGGREAAVVWLDTSNCFSAKDLADVIRSHVSRSSAGMDSGFLSDMIRQSLNHVHVFKPRSSQHLTQVLETLPEYLLDSNLHYSSSRMLSLLVVDSATAFYWPDRFEQEMARLEAGPEATSDAFVSYISRVNRMIQLLKALQAQFDCTIIFTTDPLTDPLPRRNRQSHPSTSSTTSHTLPTNLEPEDPILVSPWTAFATMTITLSRMTVPQFAPIMTIEECLRDREKRQEAVVKNRTVVQPDWSRSERWDRSVKGAMMAMQGRGAFVISLGEGGVVII